MSKFRIVLSSVWRGRGEPQTEATYYRDGQKVGREIVASEADALLNAESLYGFALGEIQVEEK
jgi:hypothetical protein